MNARQIIEASMARTYLDYGHTDGSEAWVLKGSDIKRMNTNAYGDSDLHGDHLRTKAKGRIDHEARTVTVAVTSEPEAAEYALKLLQLDFPDYRVARF